VAETSAHLRVRYAETDQMGVVHHAAYLPWLEVARTEYLRERGLPYRQLESMGIRMPVLKVEVEYRRPALYDDLLTVTARLESSSAVRFTFRYEVRRDGEGAPLCVAASHHAATGPDGRPRRIPPELLKILGGDRDPNA